MCTATVSGKHTISPMRTHNPTTSSPSSSSFTLYRAPVLLLRCFLTAGRPRVVYTPGQLVKHAPLSGEPPSDGRHLLPLHPARLEDAYYLSPCVRHNCLTTFDPTANIGPANQGSLNGITTFGPLVVRAFGWDESVYIYCPLIKRGVTRSGI